MGQSSTNSPINTSSPEKTKATKGAQVQILESLSGKLSGNTPISEAEDRDLIELTCDADAEG